MPSACWNTHPPPSSACWDKYPSAQCMLGYTPPSSACWDTVNKRAVCILLECILVNGYIQVTLLDVPEILIHIARWNFKDHEKTTQKGMDRRLSLQPSKICNLDMQCVHSCNKKVFNDVYQQML